MKKNKLTFGKRIRRFKIGLRQFVFARFKFVLRITMVILAILILIPIALTFLYSSTSIKPISTLMAVRLISGKPVERIWVNLEDINAVLVHSVMMSEDAKFCAHNGIDFDALNEVIDNALEGEKTRGASTLSMQTVKNLYLWPERSYFRKILELPLALMTDYVWGKRRMIEIYLNIAEWGDGTFGIEAASQRYFSRSSKNLNARQSALLAVALPNPKWRNAAKASRNLKRLAKNIEKRAYQSGAYIKCIEK